MTQEKWPFKTGGVPTGGVICIQNAILGNDHSRLAAHNDQVAKVLLYIE